MKKLYRCEGHIVLYVVADDIGCNPETIAQDAVCEEAGNGSVEFDEPLEVTKLEDIEPVWRESIPYSDRCLGPSCTDPDLTCSQVLELTTKEDGPQK